MGAVRQRKHAGKPQWSVRLVMLCRRVDVSGFIFFLAFATAAGFITDVAVALARTRTLMNPTASLVYYT
jgi:hypothetical protein